MSQTLSSSHALRLALSATEFESTLTFFRLLKVTQLKELYKLVGLALKGKKQDLLYRLELYTRSCYAAGENIRLLAIRSVVLKMLNHDPVPDFHNLCHALQLGLIDFQQLLQQNSQQNHRLTSGLGQVLNRKVSPSTHTHVNLMAGGYSSGNTLHGSLYYPKYSGPMLLFQSTIFYQLIRMVHGFPYMMVALKGRNVCNVPVSLNAEEIELLEQSPDARLYLFSGLSSTPNPAKTPIQFPPIEIHVDGINTKQYVKGLKGKPGTCRPADLTKYVTNLRRQFTINIVYSDALEPYILYVYIVHARSPENLVTSIEKEGSHIPIDVTKKAIQRDYEQNQDDDIVMDTSSISLRCPLTYARMKHPMKSTACDHVQCFDGLSFLTMQERIPSWICPVCSAQLDQNLLAVLDYMCEILLKTSEEVDTVLLHTDGSWSVQEDLEMKDESSSPPPKSPSAAAASTRSEPPNESIEVISLDSDSEDEAVSSESASGNPSTSSAAITVPQPSQEAQPTQEIQQPNPLHTQHQRHIEPLQHSHSSPQIQQPGYSSQRLIPGLQTSTDAGSYYHQNRSLISYTLNPPPSSEFRDAYHSLNGRQAHSSQPTHWVRYHDSSRSGSITTTANSSKGHIGMSSSRPYVTTNGNSVSGASDSSIGASGQSYTPPSANSSTILNRPFTAHPASRPQLPTPHQQSLLQQGQRHSLPLPTATAQETRQGDTTQERGDSSSDNDTLLNNRHEPSENRPLSKHRRKAPVIQDDPDLGSDSRSLPPVRANDPNRRDLQRSPPVRAFDESALALNQASPQHSYHESPILPAPRSASPQNVTRLPSINTLNQNLRNGASSTHSSGFIVPWARDQPISSSSSPEVAKNSSTAYVSGQQVSNASAMAQQQLTAGSAHGWRGAATNGINSPEPDRITQQTNREALQKDSPELSQLSKAGSVIQKIHQQYSRSSSPSAQQPQASSSSANRSALTSSGSTQETQANANAAAAAVTSLASADTDQQNTTGEKGVSHEVQSLINESQKTGIPHQRERQSQVPEVNQQPPNARQSVIAERYRQLILTSSTLINNYHKMALDTNHSNNSGIPNVPSTSQSANSQPQEGSKREISGVEGRENDATRIQQAKSERTEEQTLKEGNNTGDSMSATEVSSSTTTKGNSEQSTETTADVPALLQAQAVKPSAIHDSLTTTSEMMQKTLTGMTHSSSKNQKTRTEQEHQRLSEPEHNRPAPEPARAENYSRSAFDVLTEEDAFQKIKGVLDIEISGNLLRSRTPLATQASEPLALPSGTAVHSQSTPHVNRVQELSNGENTSPIDSRIERMSIETPNGKKRSILNSSSERSWNKRLNRQGSKKFDPSEINSSQIIELDD